MKARKRGPVPCNPKEEKFECTINGKTKTLAEWAALQGLTPEAIRARLSRRWSAHDAYTLPKGWFLPPEHLLSLEQYWLIHPGASKTRPAR